MPGVTPWHPLMKTLDLKSKFELGAVIPNYEALLAALKGNYYMLPGTVKSYFSHFFTRCFVNLLGSMVGMQVTSTWDTTINLTCSWSTMSVDFSVSHISPLHLYNKLKRTFWHKGVFIHVDYTKHQQFTAEERGFFTNWDNGRLVISSKGKRFMEIYENITGIKR